MKTYIIYDYQTDEIIGEIEAMDILDAERKACKMFNKYSNEIYALTK